MMLPASAPASLERRLFWVAAGLVFLMGVCLTLAPAVRARSWDADYRWSHWVGYVVWLGGGALLRRRLARFLPQRDVILWVSAWLLSGWGLIMIWRLSVFHGWRQTAWLGIGLALISYLIGKADLLEWLKRYKYLWLVGGLLLTALTLAFGQNPSGEGLPRLWLGCCGVYLQPSEPLKFLLLVYLSAYLAGSRKVFGEGKSSIQLASLLAPTALMVALAMGLLVVQRDLGTASLFFFLYTTQVYLATEKRRVVLFGALGILCGLLVGYGLFDVVRIRVDAWMNPWLDPSGRSYQIVQSLIAIANGGVFGRGIGMGNPGLVPVSHSDFIFAAIAEESGLAGVVGLLTLLAILVIRCLRTALRAGDEFQRLLAAGFTAYLGGQSLLIIGGNLRLLPLTGVNLPFVSYGGSSLLVSLLVLLFILQVEGQPQAVVGSLPNAEPYLNLSRLLLGGFALAAMASGWFGLYRAEALTNRTDNPRRAIADRYTLRGSLYDRDGKPLAVTVGSPGSYQRITVYPPISPLLGYSSPAYGQAGLEASLDEWLRGLRGYSVLAHSWNHLLYGTPPPGLDLRLTIDLDLQRLADEALAGRQGAIVLLNAQSGDLLAVASQPGFDANELDQEWKELISSPNAPLLNRATQGQYPLGALAKVFGEQPGKGLSLSGGQADLLKPGGFLSGQGELVYPLQAAYGAARLCTNGWQPPVRIISAIKLPNEGWTPFGGPEAPLQVLSDSQVESILKGMTEVSGNDWRIVRTVSDSGGKTVTWFIGGNLPQWQAMPYAVVVVLEDQNILAARQMGDMLMEAMKMP
ncbi:MAG: FtsW/RodA/SpoVE family cell cycle protein [Chloroflexota bacterium]